MESTNGNYVSRAEMREALAPIREDIHEIRVDVRNLLAAYNRQQGKEEQDDDTTDNSHDRHTRVLAYLAVLVALAGDIAAVFVIVHG